MDLLERHWVCRDRGFIGPDPPAAAFASASLAEWDAFALQIAPLLRAGRLGEVVLEGRAPFPQSPFDVDALTGDVERRRALLILAAAAHGFVFEPTLEGSAPRARLPSRIAVPLARVADTLEVPPTLTHSLVALANWRLVVPPGPDAEVGVSPRANDVDLLVPLLGGMDECWFFAIAIEIERIGSAALREIAVAVDETVRGGNGVSAASVAAAYGAVASTVEAMTAKLNETPQRCHPAVFYERVRVFLAGFNHAELPPEGVLFEGVGPHSGDGEHRRLFGASAAQSALIPAIDAFLGIEHPGNDFLAAMRDYMPREHRALLAFFDEHGPSVRAKARELGGAAEEAAKRAEHAMHDFRSAHIIIVTRYIVNQSRRGEGERGTGGSDLIPFLKRVRAGAAGSNGSVSSSSSSAADG